MSDQVKLPIVDDEESFRTHMKRLFAHKGYDVTDVATGQDAFVTVRKHRFDVVLLDILLPDIDGVEVLEALRQLRPDLQVIMMTGNATVENAIASMKLGAYDYLTKPCDFEELDILIQRACRFTTLQRDSKLLQHELDRMNEFDRFVGSDEKTLGILNLVGKVAPTDSTVLITGETGTGKELIARAIHRKSARNRKPFVVVNCSAIQESLLESEMFGYEKGAFTGAVRDKSGLIEVADTGTLFMDEVGDLSPALQILLLRVLENGEYRPVGSTRPKLADVRIIAATNRNLKALIQEGRFREDLFYRLNVINLELPPLRDRPADVRILAEYFLKKTCRRMGKCVGQIQADALDCLHQYHWPGNVRELENVLERAVILSPNDKITVDDLPADLSTHQAAPPPPLRSPRIPWRPWSVITSSKCWPRRAGTRRRHRGCWASRRRRCMPSSRRVGWGEEGQRWRANEEGIGEVAPSRR